MRLAWFSPMPPVPSGIAACSADLLDELVTRHDIDVFVHTTVSTRAPASSRPRAPVYSAHDFVWRHRAQPYDLTVYQVGNSSHHDYLWPYLFRYPGLTVLHDAHVHHARAAALLRTKRSSDFRTEFAATHPDIRPELAELAIAGFDNHLYYSWPMNRLVIEASRLAAVHAPPLARRLQEDLPHAHVTAIRLAHGQILSSEQISRAREHVRTARGIPRDAVVFGVFGGLTPDKRIRQVLEALDATAAYSPSVHLLLAGAPARHYDVAKDIRELGLEHRVTMTGYLATDSELTDCIAACDVSVNLRWPTAREMSGPWLRALAAGRPTITIDLAHMVDVPALDPRTWRMNAVAAGKQHPDGELRIANREPRTANREPVTVAIDILDEDHSLRLAMRRLATDPSLRASLGHAGQQYWLREHSMPRMVEDYERALAEAAALPPPKVALPQHLVTDGDRLLTEVLSEFSLDVPWSKL
jgi:glycosyltransferase involved in cell wall biosynthesis